MIWHGCRHGRSRQLAPFALLAGGLALCALAAASQLRAAEPHSANAASIGASGTAEPADLIDRRIELHWHSKSPRRWAGTVQLIPAAGHPNAEPSAEGSLVAEPVNLTPGPILAGGIQPLDACQLRFNPPARLPMLPHGEGKLISVSTTAGGLAFRVRARADQRLVVRLDADDRSPAWTTEIDLAELDEFSEIKRSIDSQSTLTSRRLAGDSFRIRLGESGTVFWTDEVVELAIDGLAAGLPPAADAELLLHCETLAADRTLVATQQWPAKIVDGRLVLEDPRWTAPTMEGPYRLRWQLRAKSEAVATQSPSRSPLALANSFTQSLSDALPASFAPPFQLPLGQSLSLTGGSEPEPLFQTEFSIAVVSQQLPAPLPNSGRTDDQIGRWRMIGKAEPPDAALSVSRLLPRQTTDWLAGAAITPGAPKAPLHEGKRLTVVQPQAVLEYAVPLSRVGQRHRALIRMPAAPVNQLAVELIDGTDTAVGSVPANQQLGQGLVITGSQLSGESGSWRTATVDFWPRSLNTRILISNPSTTQTAKFESIEIQVDEGEPAERSRSAALPPATRLAAMRLELSDFLQQFGDRGTPTLENPLDYQAVWVAGTRLIEMLNREGYGGVLLTVASDGASCYPTTLATTDASWNANWDSAGEPVDALELLLRLFDRASLTLVPCIRPSSPLTALEQAIDSASAAGSSIAAPSPLGGKLGNWNFDGPPITSFGIYNPKNSSVAEQAGALLGELRRRCAAHRCVSTIGVIVDERTYLRLSPVALTDPQTLDDFHASLGPGAPSRATLAQWIQQDGAAAYENWRMDQAEAIFRQILQQLGDQPLVVLSLDSALPSNLVELGRHPRILTARLHRRSLIEPLGLRIRDEACNASIPISAGPSKTAWSHDVGIFHQPVTELRRTSGSSPADSAGAPGDGIDARPTASFTPLLDPLESSLAFAQLLNRSDRTMLAIGGGAINQAGSETRRRSLRCFSQLPAVSMEDIASDPGLISAVRVRWARFGGDTYIYANNQTHWPISLDMSFSRGVAFVPLGQEPGVTSGAVSAARWNPTLAPGELAAIRIAGEDLEVVNWQAALASQAQDLTHIRNYVQEAVGALTQFVEPTRLDPIQNNGFEQAAPEGIPGWLTAQYPPGCVAIDSAVAFAGKQSVRLTGQAGQAGGSWIVSQVIAPPDSCRLAVSLRLRGQRANNARSAPPLVVRVALEGTVAGTPIRKTRSISVPRDGNWSEPAERLEIALLPSVPVESLRLTIDLMSDGVVWVDEVSFYDHFVTNGEKTQLDHLVYLAAGGASRGDWTGASRLLDSHWVHDLATARGPVNRGASQPHVVGEAAQAAHQIDSGGTNGAGSPSPPAGKNSPAAGQPLGIGERLKSWLPRPVRF